MKVFYGVQGTGNGHITRARVMSKALAEAGVEVKFQFTGRPAQHYFDMEVFNDYDVRTGLTFNTHRGQVNYLKTVWESRPITFIRDVKSLDLSDYDLVITDFEPVTAWAAKRQKKKVLGIGHQYAFQHQIPRDGSDPLASTVMKYFAPADLGIGLHWHHFDQPILPPIIATPSLPQRFLKHKVLVYLPFEDTTEVFELLSPYTTHEFYVYTPNPKPSEHAHILCKPLSRDGFQQDLYDCSGIISNAGFELASEALHLGKKILVKPLGQQMEQISNARALQNLGYGHVMQALNGQAIETWLEDNRAIQISYPHVASILTQWLLDGMPALDKSFFSHVWRDVAVNEVRQ